jgi:hypothetical protein
MVLSSFIRFMNAALALLLASRHTFTHKNFVGGVEFCKTNTDRIHRGCQTANIAVR